MNLVRLIYASRFCVDKFDPKELANINRSSQKNNKVLDISGSLVFGEDFFLQCLEGGQEAVSKTFHRISNDPRHESIIMINFEEIDQREFSEWEMKFVVLTEANTALIKKYSTTSKFNPIKMHASNALELMKALRKD